MKDYYKILEVHPQASEEIIRKAYQVLVLRYHPDRHVPVRKKWAEEKFKELSEAYQVLSDSAKRRRYDRDGYSEQLAQDSRTVSTRVNEEAYFYSRMGREHYRCAQKKTFWRILFGIVESDLKKAEDDLVTVLDDYSTSKYVEDAHFYYLCTLTETYEYGEEFLKETEKEFNEFFDQFPRSKWACEVKIRFAKFCLFKKKDYSKAEEILSNFVYLYSKEGLAEEAKILLECVQGLKERLVLKKEKKSG